jgi:hypothetical protein
MNTFILRSAVLLGSALRNGLQPTAWDFLWIPLNSSDEPLFPHISEGQTIEIWKLIPFISLEFVSRLNRLGHKGNWVREFCWPMWIILRSLLFFGLYLLYLRYHISQSPLIHVVMLLTNNTIFSLDCWAQASTILTVPSAWSVGESGTTGCLGRGQSPDQ